MRSRMMILASVSLAMLTVASVSALRAGPEEPKSVVDPEAALSDAEKRSLHSSLSDAWFKDASDWARSQTFTSDELRKLPKEELNATLEGGSESVKEAVERADLVAHVVVTSVVWAAFGSPFNAVISVNVVDYLKGSGSEGLLVVQAAAHLPGEGWSRRGAHIGQTSADPVLLPGDEAVLLLQKVGVVGAGSLQGDGRFSAGQTVYRVQSVTGSYRIHAGRAEPAEGNELISIEELSSIDSLVGVLRAILR